MAVITISRQYGSLGNEIAGKLSELLGYKAFDRRLMVDVAREMGLAQNELLDFTEDKYQIRGFLDRVLGRYSPRVIARVGTWQETGSGARTKSMHEFDESYGITLEQQTILAAYELGNVVIVGRGGQSILKGKLGALHVRIIAPFNLRVERLRDRDGLAWEDARAAINRYDRASAEYLRHFYHVNWADPMLYDLVINTEQLGVEQAAQMIATLVRRPAIEAAPVEAIA